ncbi:amylo-alpha-1,6-glucosidase [Bacteroidales bacterium OttesenSCG-928-B11]|nr:amylo-alpha-1,6-glucosidase [Bacteroidales bacterium OttesenSCG-928-E04]MDL2311976.1 amylo-alpha-1,6-glucosidase [Bacteroidales bacterium OttesenSCG-928-B11]MDL2326834.1 amylo-alpha-1,6-glucosidase [Bacteroidales bacterium OttesenSCG-928-A14]
MSYIEFDKDKLVNLDFSKNKELLRCSGTGSFSQTTLAGLNTRKYHGLFIVPQDKLGGERHVLVSGLNEAIVINDLEFHLGVHQYKTKVIDPKGHKYLQKFDADPIPTYRYRVGKFNFKKEFLFLQGADRIIIKYTILDEIESASIQFNPLLAFREIHQLSHENEAVDKSFKSIKNGVQYCLYPGFTPVSIQCSADDVLNYQHEPVWYRNFEYEQEINRGYDGYEDLYNPGKLNVEINNRDIYITIGLEEIDPQEIENLFQKELENHSSRSTFYNCLKNAAQQFIVERNNKTEVIAGYPWFGRWGRDTFIALPGLTLALKNSALCKKILDDMLAEMQHGLFPNIGNGEAAAYNSVDAPLWFVRTLQQYSVFTKTQKKIWIEYGRHLKAILNAYKNGSLYNIRMLENGLIYAGNENVALTWMDAVVHGTPVTPRTGCQVEINGLWYNAISFCMEMAGLAGDKEFVGEWERLAANFPAVFKETFWSKEKGYLADFVNGDYKNFQVRPNMMIVTSLPYIPVSEKIRQLILKKTLEELLTIRGIRTLSPSDPDYKGSYGGTQEVRDRAYHQGTCWPWLLAPFADGLIAVYQKKAYPMLKKILFDFEPCMKEYGLSTVAEIYDGNPPHRPNGCVSQAWSVSALLYIKYLLEKAGEI